MAVPVAPVPTALNYMCIIFFQFVNYFLLTASTWKKPAGGDKYVFKMFASFLFVRMIRLSFMILFFYFLSFFFTFFCFLVVSFLSFLLFLLLLPFFFLLLLLFFFLRLLSLVLSDIRVSASTAFFGRCRCYGILPDVVVHTYTCIPTLSSDEFTWQ